MTRRGRRGIISLANLIRAEEGSVTIAGDSWINSGFSCKGIPTTTDNTIYRMSPFDAVQTVITRGPSERILPGDTVVLKLSFTTVLPSPHSMRMGLFGGVTKASYWYPQVCVYDRKFGWNNGQYLGWGECYGDYGKFEVNITAPEDVIIAATGICENEYEVLPDSLKRMLDLSNYLKPRAEWPKFSYDTSRTKTWKFIAENVNDFAFVASRDYCIDWDTTGYTEVVAYALKQNARRWQNATKDGKDAIETLSELYIPYQYPVMRICDAFGGMEYPMLVHCAGGPPSPGWYIVVYHEVAHNWFMGMIGSNQADRPFLDEGFTTHAEHNVMEKYLGRYDNVNNHRTWYARQFAPDDEDRNTRGFRPLLEMMIDGFDKPMAFSYDQGEEYFPYRVSAYYKSAAMHYNLRAILGDSAYFKAMQEYCRDWLFRHPYEEDFAASIEKSTGLELDMFFQQWFHGRQRLDYGVKKVKRRGSGADAFTEVTLVNKGRFVSPVNVAAIDNKGDTSFYAVAPEGMSFAKPGFTVTPTWHQFRRFDETFTFTIPGERKVRKVVVDPENLLMDIDRMNNSSSRLDPIELRLDNMKYDRVPVNEYALRWRPDLWYDEPNGVQLGGHLHGSYLGKLNRFSLDARYGVDSKLPYLDLESATPMGSSKLAPEFGYRMLLADHRIYSRSSIDFEFKKRWSRPDREFLKLDMEYLDISDEQAARLSAPPDELLPYIAEPNWDGGRTYTFTLTSGMVRTFRYGTWKMTSRVAVGGHEYSESARGFSDTELRAELKLNRSGDGSTPWLQLRATASDLGGQPPSHKIKHLSRATAYDQFVHSQVFRTPGTFPVEWSDELYLSAERVRGYQDRLVYTSESYGGSIELTPLRRMPLPLVKELPMVGGFLAKANMSLFVDGATASLEGSEFAFRQPIRSSETRLNDGDLYLSSGVSITLPPVWSEHRVRLDFPLYLSKPAPGDDKFEFRFSVAWIMPSMY